VLLAAAEAARAARAEVRFDGVRTTVYKALHVAKLGGLFERAPHGSPAA
jgi:ABC-type nitrate/sulfonate/bicarbonate transport system substrate-binding protein